MSFRGHLCATAPLTCPGHLHPLTRCDPPRVAISEIDVISRQVPTFGQPYVHLAEAVLVKDTPPPAGTSVNVSLLLDVLAFLDRNPRRWTQHRYLSEVDGHLVGCVAGWAVVLGGVAATPDFILSTRDGIELHRMAAEVLGFTEFQAGAVFGYTHADSTDLGLVRHPTFAELCDRIFEVTHVRYTPQGAPS